MEKGELYNVVTLDYSKKEIVPYVRKDGDFYEFIPFGPDNLFPQALALFSRLSPNHRGVLTSKNRYFHGDGIVGLNPETTKWVESANNERMNLNQIQKRLWIDKHTFGNEYIELITDKKGSFLFVNHIDATKCRISKNEEEILLHPDWSKYTGEKDPLRIAVGKYPNWTEDPEKAGIYRSIYHKFEYEPEFTYYGIVSYISGKDSIQIDFKTNKWNLARLVNSFRPSSMIFVPVKDASESSKVINEINKHVGDGNQGKTFVVTKSRALEGQKAEDVNIVELKTEDNGSWMSLHTQSFSDIIMAHGWFRSLCSANDNTGFDTKRIINEYNIAKPSIIEAQNEYVALYTRLYNEVTGKAINLQFQNTPPLQTYKYYFVWEAREKQGLPVDKTDPEQMKIIMTD